MNTKKAIARIIRNPIIAYIMTANHSDRLCNGAQRAVAETVVWVKSLATAATTSGQVAKIAAVEGKSTLLDSKLG